MEKGSSKKLKCLGLDKEFMLFQHLKYNLKNYTKVCEIHDSDLTSYCLQCQISICEVCMSSIHASHNYIVKADYPFDQNFYEKVFSEFESEIKKIEEMVQPNQVIKNYNIAVEKEMDDIIDKLKELKTKRLKEFNNMFESQGIDCKKLRVAVKKTKEQFAKYFIRYKNLFDASSLGFPSYIQLEDDDNFIFLHNFDMINECLLKIQQYTNVISQIKSTYSTLKDATNSKFTDLLKMVDNLLIEQKKKEIKQTNAKIWNTIDEPKWESASGQDRRKSISVNLNSSVNNSSNNNKDASANFTQRLVSYYDKINEDLFLPLRNKIEVFDLFNDGFRNQVYESIRKTQSLNEITRLVKAFEDKLAKRVKVGSGSRKINLNKSLRSKIFSSREHSPSSSKSISVRSSKACLNNAPGRKSKIVAEESNENIASMNRGKNCYSDNEFSRVEDVKDGIVNEESQDEISRDQEQIKVDSKTIKASENRDSIFKKIDRIFMPPNLNKTRNLKSINSKNREMKKSNNNKIKLNLDLADQTFENSKMTKFLSSKEKVTLIIPIIRKYFSFMLIDHLRTSIPKSDSTNDKSMIDLFEHHPDNEDFKSIVPKIIEGTNEINLYNKLTKTLEKIKVTFEANKQYGTKTFYKGCRFQLINGKIYICGGKDSSGDKHLFMVYSLTDHRLHKLSDMKYPRSFHSISFNESMKALLAIGGENNNTCEMYDFYLNLWTELHEMNYARANTTFLTNSSGSFGYTFFGISGDIVNMKFSDIIEVIDIIDMNKGWYKVEYINNTGVDIKSRELKVYLVATDKFLIYGGGLERRQSVPCYLMFDLKTLEMTKIDSMQAELLKQTECSKEINVKANQDKAGKKTVRSKKGSVRYNRTDEAN